MLAARSAVLPMLVLVVFLASASAFDEKPQPSPRAFIDGEGPDWKTLGETDFVMVNGDKDTWTWKDGVLYCTGKPVGVTRSAKEYTNFEVSLQWMHEKRSGNSGVFVWTPEAALKGLKPNQLPSGIEVQILDHGYLEDYETQQKKKATWFTTNGDVFRVGKSKLDPYAPKSPDGSRSFPRKNTTKGFGQWNHYYVRAINGEIRLWVNGEEVSGGKNADPKSGYMCLESEGSPIQFKNIRLRELP